ncbi:unnamed protein product [Clonostachys rhizophaga]|uniref:Rhodopsin domain-containing protein n=1 Tax=Clonostachys rhizophaga TaxID=160324 RepID=A0A9N9YKI3_9HYPO|nr:unnamed protein product [Clonostachys rhizophaga]
MAGQESYEAFRVRFDGAAISTYALLMIVVPMKIWCRTQVSGWKSIGWDDWLSVATLAFVNVWFWDNMIGVRPYLGKHVGTGESEVNPEQLEYFLKCLYVASISYVVSIVFIKLTILAFYWKLFSVAARWPIRILAASVVAWLIAFVYLGAFGCLPIRAQWDVTAMATAKCVPPKSIYLGASLPNVITDLILVLMPIPYVWRLNIALQQRLILAGLFLLGLFICIVSIIRLTIVMSISTDDHDTTYNLKDFMLWSIVEVNIGLVCSCLPSMRHILKAIGLGRFFSLSYGPNGQNTPGRRPNSDPTGVNTGSSGGRVLRSRQNASNNSGLWWGNTGLSRIDSDEDAYQMIDHVAGANVSAAAAENGQQSGQETDQGSTEEGGDGSKNGGIVVHQSWSVMTDGKGS